MVGIGMAIISTAGPTIMNGIVGVVNGRKDEKRAREKRRNLENTLQGLEAKRQAFVNPYESVTDLSGNLSNAYANLGVATQAAEIQIEQTDMALANTLDTIRATGGGAGGATALAQAALASKKGVAASIEGQEAANDKLRAQGEQQLQQQRMQEGIRIQNAGVSGDIFEFNKLEADLDRSQAMVDEQRAREMQGKIDERAAFSSMMSGISKSSGSLFAAAISNGGLGSGGGGGGDDDGGGDDYGGGDAVPASITGSTPLFA
tara:strand:+ start:5923 stop:6705 length:783 start_codon:yes stop_codon:yes gene_type:complete